MNTKFEDFQEHFKKYQRRFGLMGYQAFFKHEPLEDYFADITVDQNGMTATVRYNSKLPEKDKPFEDVRRTAKHEAIHLLLGRLEFTAKARYVSDTEIGEAAEELVHKLEELIE